LLEGDSVQEFEAQLSALECGNGLMVGANFDYDRPNLPANTKRNTCFFDLSCRHDFHLLEDIAFPAPPGGRARNGAAAAVDIVLLQAESLQVTDVRGTGTGALAVAGRDGGAIRAKGADYEGLAKSV